METQQLYDNHNRPLNYLRLAVTDKCNLRCGYCMPENICFAKNEELLSIDEMKRIVSILSDLGIHKIRLTGGEPLLRKGIIDFIRWLKKNPDIHAIHITSNGTVLNKYVSDLKNLGISSVNLSLDTLDKEKFFQITKRDQFTEVKSCIEALLLNKINLKINMVVMPGINIDDIIPMVKFTAKNNCSVRFIEQMPFNGSKFEGQEFFDHQKILELIKSSFPQIERLKDPLYSTSYNYKVKDYAGSFGIIPAFSRTFCGTCNRIRINATGVLKTCLYDNGVFNIKTLLRNGISDDDLINEFKKAFANRVKDGFEAQQSADRNNNIFESMTTIGG